MPTRRLDRSWQGTPFALEVHDSGPSDGPIAVLLHGFPQHHGIFDGVLPALHDLGLRTLAVDQRGYSATPQPDDVAAYVLPELVADAVAVLDDVGAPGAVVVGHDWGAAVAWALAAAHPGRVHGLAALSVPHPRAYGHALKHDAQQAELSRYLRLLREEDTAERVLLDDDARRLRGFFRGSALADDEVERYVAPLRDVERLRGALAWYRAMTGPEFAAVGPVDVPTVYVSAEHDLGVGRAAAAGCADWCRGLYRHVDLAGATHWIVDEHPDVVVDAVRSLLAPAHW
ncbi:alpha/beta hydrolase [Angustibacter peucedani]